MMIGPAPAYTAPQTAEGNALNTSGVGRAAPIVHGVMGGAGVLGLGFGAMMTAIWWQLGSRKKITPWLGYSLAGLSGLGVAWNVYATTQHFSRMQQSIEGRDQPIFPEWP